VKVEDQLMRTQKYQIRLRGLIDRSWSDYFAGMSMTVEPPGVTRLLGEVADRSALYGLLNRIAGLNLGIISVQLLDEDGVTPVECRHCPAGRPMKDMEYISSYEAVVASSAIQGGKWLPEAMGSCGLTSASSPGSPSRPSWCA
jgi:hypothetical protein